MRTRLCLDVVLGVENFLSFFLRAHGLEKLTLILGSGLD